MRVVRHWLSCSFVLLWTLIYTPLNNSQSQIAVESVLKKNSEVSTYRKGIYIERMLQTTNSISAILLADSLIPTITPSSPPSHESPSLLPSQSPTSRHPTVNLIPSNTPTFQPSLLPSESPSLSPVLPTLSPTPLPTFIQTTPTYSPSTRKPSHKPSLRPSKEPTIAPSSMPTTIRPTNVPTVLPTLQTQTELQFEISCVLEQNTFLNSFLSSEELNAIILAESNVMQISSSKFHFLAQTSVQIVNNSILPSNSRYLLTSTGFQVFNELKVSLIDFPNLNNNETLLYKQLLEQIALVNNRSLLTIELRRIANVNQIDRLKTIEVRNVDLSLPLVIQSPTFYPTFAPTKGERTLGDLSIWEFAIVICFSVLGFVFLLLVFRFSDRIYVTKNYRVSSSYEQEQDDHEAKIDEVNPYLTPINFIAHKKGYDEFLDSQFMKAKKQKQYLRDTKKFQKSNAKFTYERSEKPKPSGMSTSTVLNV